MKTLTALQLAQAALNTAPRFKIPSLPTEYDDSYKVALAIDNAVRKEGEGLEKSAAIETLADICYQAGVAKYYGGNSRDDIDTFIQWANEFEATVIIDEDGASYNGTDYMDAIEIFTQAKLADEGRAQ